MNGILDGKFLSKGTITEDKFSEEVINKLENTGSVGVENLIAKKWILDWRNYTDLPHSICYPSRDEDGEYLRINPVTVHNDISTEECNDVFFGKIKFKENTRYTVKIKVKRLIDGESGSGAFYINAKYTDGTKSTIVRPTRETSPIGEVKEFSGTSMEGKTIANIYITYGSGHILALYDIMLTEGTQAPEGYIPHVEDLPEIVHNEDTLKGKATGVCTAEGGYYRPNAENDTILSSVKTMELLIYTPKDLSPYTTNTSEYIFRVVSNSINVLAVTFYVNIEANNQSIFFYTNGSDAYNRSKRVELNKTYHVVGTLDEVNNLLKLYIDNELIGEINYVPIEDTPTSFLLGSFSNTGTGTQYVNNFTGTIHHARVFDYPFTEEDAAKFWNNGRPWAFSLHENNKKGLVAEYLPSGFTKTHAIDTSGNDIHLFVNTFNYNPVLTYDQFTEAEQIEEINKKFDEYLPLSGGIVTGNLVMNQNLIDLGSTMSQFIRALDTGTTLQSNKLIRLNATTTSNIELNTSGGIASYNSNEIATVNDLPTIAKATGNSDTSVMSQKAITEALSKKIDISELSTVQEDTTGGTKVLEVTSSVVSVLATSQTNYTGFSTDRRMVRVINNSELQVIFSLEMESAGQNRILKDFDVSAIILPKACSIELFNTGSGWRIVNTFGFTFLPDFANANRQGDYALKISNDGSVSAEEIADFVTVDESVTTDLTSEQLDELFPEAVSGFQYICPSGNSIYTKVSPLGGWVKYSTTRV